MFRRPLSLHLPLLMAALLPAMTTACGNDLSDSDFGGVDLKPFFGDATSKSPPLTISTAAHGGFRDGDEVTYMDFGWSASIKDTPDEDRRTLLGLGPTDKIPKVAPVNPMYFFFDSKGNPMFSAPVREKKTGNFVMAGGPAVRDPNPQEDAIKELAYPVRARSLLKDPFRNVADYQRPIIDVLFDRDKDETLQRYSGLWEFVKVTAPDGYEPDTIKSWSTLEQGVNDKSFSLKTSKLDPTVENTELLAINCPLLDSRSLVIPNISAYQTDQPRIPQPRIELWYRRKRIDCFLVNGWESLGKTTADPAGAGNDKYTLYKSSEDKLRIGVLDTDTVVFGKGIGEKRQVVSPLGQLFIPRLSARSEYFYVDSSYLTTGSLPRRNKADAPGYRPVRWWWNIDVSDFGEMFIAKTFQEAGMRDVRHIDDAKLSPREGITLNFPLTSRKLTCVGATEGNDPCVPLGLVCSGLQDGAAFECETKKVRYGEVCGPTIAQCRNVVHKPSATQKGDLIEDWMVNATVPLASPAMSITAEDVAAFKEKVPKEWQDKQAESFAAAHRIVERGGDIYSCLRLPLNEQGHCYLSCDGSKSNRLQGQFVTETLDIGGGRKVEAKFPLDTRCGGELMPGFRCLPVSNESTDGGGQWCMRDCLAGNGVDVNKATCQRPTPGYFSDEQAGMDIAKFTTCQSINLVDPNDPTAVTSTFAACERDPSFAPFPKN